MAAKVMSAVGLLGRILTYMFLRRHWGIQGIPVPLVLAVVHEHIRTGALGGLRALGYTTIP